MKVKALPEVQGKAVAQKQSPDGGGTAVAGDLLAPAHQRGIEQPKDVKLVGDEASVGKETPGKALVDVAHVERDDAHVLAAWDVREGSFELGDGTAIDHFHEAFAAEVDDHGDEVARSKTPIAAEKVLIEADDVGPWVEAFATFELEMSIECAVEKSSGATEVPPHLLQIAVPLAGSEQRPSVALGVSSPFANARHRFGERLAARFAPKPPLTDGESNLRGAQRLVLDPDSPAVIAAHRDGGPSRAVHRPCWRNSCAPTRDSSGRGVGPYGDSGVDRRLRRTRSACRPRNAESKQYPRALNLAG
jgi:hypothetical protein